MNRTDTRYKKIRYADKKLNTNKKNSKIPNHKITALLEQKHKKQNMVFQIETTINNLEDLKLTKKPSNGNIFINEKITYYRELIIFYKKEIQNICNVLKSKCIHVIVNDSIDISPEESQNINYCEKCETTF